MDNDKLNYLDNTDTRTLITSVLGNKENVEYVAEVLIKISLNSLNNNIQEGILAKTVSSLVKKIGPKTTPDSFFVHLSNSLVDIDNKYSSISTKDMVLDMYRMSPKELKFPLLYLYTTGDTSVLSRYRNLDLMVNLICNVISGERYDKMENSSAVDNITRQLDTVCKKSMFLFFLKKHYPDIFSLMVFTKSIPASYYIVSNLDIVSMNSNEFIYAIKRCTDLAIDSVKLKHHKNPLLEVMSEDIVFDGEVYDINKAIYDVVYKLWDNIDEDMESLSIVKKIKLASKELSDYTKLIKNIKKNL